MEKTAWAILFPNSEVNVHRDFSKFFELNRVGTITVEPLKATCTYENMFPVEPKLKLISYQSGLYMNFVPKNPSDFKEEIDTMGFGSKEVPLNNN